MSDGTCNSLQSKAIHTIEEEFVVKLGTQESSQEESESGPLDTNSERKLPDWMRDKKVVAEEELTQDQTRQRKKSEFKGDQCAETTTKLFRDVREPVSLLQGNFSPPYSHKVVVYALMWKLLDLLVTMGV